VGALVVVGWESDRATTVFYSDLYWFLGAFGCLGILGFLGFQAHFLPNGFGTELLHGKLRENGLINVKNDYFNGKINHFFNGLHF